MNEPDNPVIEARRKIEERIDELTAEQHYWIAEHAIRRGLFKLAPERKAELDPLGMIDPRYKSEDLTRLLNRDELESASESGYDDYWETADHEAQESYDTTAGHIYGLREALAILSGER